MNADAFSQPGRTRSQALGSTAHYAHMQTSKIPRAALPSPGGSRTPEPPRLLVALAMAEPSHGAAPFWPYHKDLGIRIGLYVLALMWDTPRSSPWPKRSPRTPTTLHLAGADAFQGAAVPCTFRLSPAASLDMVVPMDSSLANHT